MQPTKHFRAILLSLTAVMLLSCAGCPADDPCPVTEKDEIDSPDCCPGEAPITEFNFQEVVVDPRVRKGNSIMNELIHDGKVMVCPCDGSLGLVDTTGFSEEEKAAVASSQKGGEGNPIFNLPEPETYDHRFIVDVPEIESPEGPANDAVKLAILDSGLQGNISHFFNLHISQKLNLYPPFSEDVEDITGHGSVVFTIIANNTFGKIKYFIYKCTNDEGKSSGFTLACALQCARRNRVDIINISLGSYIDDQLVKEIIDENLDWPAVITSQGNDCLLNDALPHFPSDYQRAYGIIGVYDDTADPSMQVPGLWGCTNGFSEETEKNIAAPAMICTSLSNVRFGTSFAAAFATNRFAQFLYDNNISSNRRLAFQDQFLNNATEENTVQVERYLYAAEACVDVTVIK